MDVGQNGRPLMGPQMWMSSLVFTIQWLGYLILTHTHIYMAMIYIGVPKMILGLYIYIHMYIYIYVIVLNHPTGWLRLSNRLRHSCRPSGPSLGATWGFFGAWGWFLTSRGSSMVLWENPRKTYRKMVVLPSKRWFFWIGDNNDNRGFL